MKNKKCLVKECNKSYKAKGYCVNHYMIYKNKGLIKGYLICSVIGCAFTVYAKGLCHNHYELNLRNGKPQYKAHSPQKCKVDNCNELATPLRELCNFHQRRQLNGTPLSIPKGSAFKSERNPRWNGGTSEYPNHAVMKRVRKEVLKEANYICHFCGGLADRIHHLDKSKNNHSKENLIPICAKCHCKFNQSKFKKLYGFKRLEMIKKLSLPYYKFDYLHKNNMLKPYLRTFLC